MKGILTENVRILPKSGSLMSLFLRGIEREQKFLASALDNPDNNWRKFVRKEWVKDQCSLDQMTTGAESLIPWVCISFETWYKLLDKHMVRTDEK